MAAVAFAMLAALSFGGLAVAVAWGLRRHADPETGALAAAGVAAILSVALAVPFAAASGVNARALAPFALAGLIAPGASQIILTRAIDHAGASRAALLAGTAPLISITLAVTVLGEPLRPALVLGAVLIVLGGASLTRERIHPERFRIRGVMLALLCAALFASRDNLLRWAARSEHPSSLVAAATTLLVAALVIAVYRSVSGHRRPTGDLLRAVPAFAPAGLALAIGYNALIAAFEHGRVIIVSPLNATGSLWSVILAAMTIGRSERIGRHTVLAAVLIVAGGAVVGVLH
jgi:drug/metabolite transporter (DMT)-like permease